VLLLGCPNDRGVLFFPLPSRKPPGICIEVNPLLPINEQLITAVTDSVEKVISPFKIDIMQNTNLTLDLENGSEATLYLAKLHPDLVKPDEKSWYKLPEILSKIRGESYRRVYLKAMQGFAWGVNDSLRAVVSEELL